MEKILNFLSGLSKNNSREWFNDHRREYEESRDKMFFYTEVFINEIRKFDTEIPVTDPKECLFRIFRDIRFSNDKRPYKTNMGSFIAKGGRKSAHAGYYFHIEPDSNFAGGGIYMPPAEPLKAIRMAIYENPDEFISLVENKNFKKTFTEFYGEKLKTAPKGFPKDFEHINLLLHKSYAFGHQLNNDEVKGENFIETTLDIFKNLAPVNRFLNEALVKYL
ncbi:MAG: DUF2461 domain-containing protein [Prolixibacteraceae bacterium]|nr:DUF2461 domain-containing protein [Prolixibacteraceae bacterium]MBN2773330.1 DUF2461 domain-containing protein [Prolixibacteraceae bacterium]